MEIPYDLRDAIEEYAGRYQVKQLKEAAALLTQRYTSESGAGKRLVTKDVETAAYAVVRMPATFGAVSSALEYTFSCLPEEETASVNTILDIGAGTGTASWAVREVLGEGLSYTCVEREASMIDYARRLMDLDKDLKEARWIRQDFSSAEKFLQADLVIASYSLNELSPDRRKKVLLSLWQNTKKLLILIEPGTPEGFAQLRSAREILLQQGGHICAPCTHEGSCPLPEEDWCHFTARIPRSRLHKTLKDAEVPYEDEKYTFLAVTKGISAPAKARILRHPLKESKRIGLTLCTPEGIRNENITKSHASFKAARKAAAGDAFRI